MNMSTHGKLCLHRHQRGFTLVEVLIALGISGIALSSILLYVSELTDASAHLRDKTIARWIAEDKMTEIKLERRLSERVLRGESTGQVSVAGNHWNWRVNSQPSPVRGLRKLEITVSDNQPDSQPLVELTGLMEE